MQYSSQIYNTLVEVKQKGMESYIDRNSYIKILDKFSPEVEKFLTLLFEKLIPNFRLHSQIFKRRFGKKQKTNFPQNHIQN